LRNMNSRFPPIVYQKTFETEFVVRAYFCTCVLSAIGT
jgi:hypothetical protein